MKKREQGEEKKLRRTPQKNLTDVFPKILNSLDSCDESLRILDAARQQEVQVDLLLNKENENKNENQNQNENENEDEDESEQFQENEQFNESEQDLPDDQIGHDPNLPSWEKPQTISHYMSNGTVAEDGVSHPVNHISLVHGG